MVELLGIIGSVVHPIVPVEAEPTHVPLDRFFKLDCFFTGIRVVETQVAKTVIFSRHAKVQTYRFRMADMQIAVRFGRKSRVYTAAILICFDIFGHALPNKVEGNHGF